MRNQQYIQNLCRNIRILRERNGLTAEALAKQLKIPEAAVQDMENGILPEDLTLETLVRVEKEFGISLKDLFLPLE